MAKRSHTRWRSRSRPEGHRTVRHDDQTRNHQEQGGPARSWATPTAASTGFNNSTKPEGKERCERSASANPSSRIGASRRSKRPCCKCLSIDPPVEFQGFQMTEWFSTMDDRLWLPPDEVGEEEARFVLKALHLRPEDAVLDAPCGAGRVAVHLARAGCIVTGLDLRAGFVARARRRFRSEGLRGTFRVQDLRELNVEGRFDGILNWAGSFGYFSQSDNARLVTAYVRALRPGGRLLIEQPDREYLLRHFRRVIRIGTLVVRNRWDARMQRVITRRIIDGADEPRNISTMRLYTPSQLRDLFKRCGLTVERLRKSLRFDAYGRALPRSSHRGSKDRPSVPTR